MTLNPVKNCLRRPRKQLPSTVTHIRLLHLKNNNWLFMKSRMNYVSTVSVDICSCSFCFSLYQFIIIMMSLAEKKFWFWEYFTVYFLKLPVFFLCFLYTLFKVFFSQSWGKKCLGHLAPTMVGPAADTKPSVISHLRFFKTWQPWATNDFNQLKPVIWKSRLPGRMKQLIKNKSRGSQ